MHGQGSPKNRQSIARCALRGSNEGKLHGLIGFCSPAAFVSNLVKRPVSEQRSSGPAISKFRMLVLSCLFFQLMAVTNSAWLSAQSWLPGQASPINSSPPTPSLSTAAPANYQATSADASLTNGLVRPATSLGSGAPTAALIPSAVNPAEEPGKVQTRQRVLFRFTWGGGAARSWEGKLWLTDARGQRVMDWEALRLLSIDKDAPGSVLLDSRDQSVRLRTLLPSPYCSFQISVPADPNLQLQLTMGSTEAHTRRVQASVSLAEVMTSGWSATLDNQGNGFWIERPSEDRLRFRFPSPLQVVGAGERFEFGVEAVQTGLKAATSVDWVVSMIATGKRNSDAETLWQESGPGTVDSTGSISRLGTWTLVAPETPGVYELMAKLSFDRSNVLPFAGKESLQRRYQFVVIPNSSSQAVVTEQPQAMEPGPPESVSIKPEQLDSSWSSRLAEVPRISVFPRLNSVSRSSTELYTNYGTEAIEFRRDEERAWWTLPAGHWRAIELTGLRPGGYWLQTIVRNPAEGRLAVTVLQPDANGSYSSLQAGVGLKNPMLLGAGWSMDSEQAWHQPVWINPVNTKPPVLLLQNPGSDSIEIGNLNWNAMASTGSLAKATSGRRAIELYLQTPLLPTVMQASKTEASQQKPSLNDWGTGWQSVERLVQLMKQQELSTVWLPVLSQGGSLYDSQLYHTSLRYENSGFATQVQTNSKMDLVKLLLSRLSNEGMGLVPVLDFSGTLELVEQRSLEAGVPVPWLGDDSTSLHYDPLHPIVRQSLKAIVREFVQRYRKHHGLKGIGISLGPDSHLLFFNEVQGSEDLATFQAFLEQTGALWPEGSGAVQQSTAAQRARFVLGPAGESWLSWRANQMTQLLDELGQIAKDEAGDPQFQVEFIAENWLTHPAIKPAAYPNLRTNLDWQQEALRMGMDLVALGQENINGRLRFQWGSNPTDHLAQQRVSTFAFHRDALWRLHQTLSLAAPLFQDSLEVLDLSGLSLGGTRHPGLQTLVSYSSPTARLKYWSESLWWGDRQGLQRQSWSAGAGSSPEELQFQRAFAQLPLSTFQTVHRDANSSVVIRQELGAAQPLAYLVNAAPWPVTVSVPEWRKGVGVESLSQLSTGQPWEVRQGDDGAEMLLPAYSLLVVRLDQPLSGKDISTRDQEGVLETVKDIKDALFRKLQQASKPKSWPYLINGDFEEEEPTLKSWSTGVSEGQAIEVDATLAHTGRQSLHLVNREGVLWLRSQPMVPVTTGRVSIAAWLRVHPQSTSRTVRLSIDAETTTGQKYYRFAEVKLDDQREATGWQAVAAHFDDLPEEGLKHFRIGLDLMQPGEFWIDSVHCFDRWFDANDQRILANRLGLMNYALEQRSQSFAAYQMLGDYWLNFLYEHIEDPGTPGPMEQAQATAKSTDNNVHEADLPAWSSRVKRRLFNLR